MLVGAFSASVTIGGHGLTLVLAALLGCAATQCFNDYEDREVDALNASFRPIPSGGLSASSVIVGGHLLTLAWALLSLCCAPEAALIKPSTPLPGEAELAARKGTWTYKPGSA